MASTLPHALLPSRGITGVFTTLRKGFFHPEYPWEQRGVFQRGFWEGALAHKAPAQQAGSWGCVWVGAEPPHSSWGSPGLWSAAAPKKCQPKSWDHFNSRGVESGFSKIGGRRGNIHQVKKSILLPPLPDTEKKIKTQASFFKYDKIKLSYFSEK